MIVALGWWQQWIWPAGRNGGTPGDVLGTLEWTVIALVIGSLLYPPIRKRIERFVKRHVASVHEKIEEIHAREVEQREVHHQELMDQAAAHHEAQLKLAMAHHQAQLEALERRRGVTKKSPTPTAKSTKKVTAKAPVKKARKR